MSFVCMCVALLLRLTISFHCSTQRRQLPESELLTADALRKARRFDLPVFFKILLAFFWRQVNEVVHFI